MNDDSGISLDLTLDQWFCLLGTVDAVLTHLALGCELRLNEHDAERLQEIRYEMIHGPNNPTR